MNSTLGRPWTALCDERESASTIEVLVLGMLEEIIDAVQLHQPADERQIGFAILYAIGNFLVVAIGPEFEVVESRLVEHILDDVLDVLVEKYPAIGLVAKQPEPWPQA